MGRRIRYACMAAVLFMMMMAGCFKAGFFFIEDLYGPAALWGCALCIQMFSLGPQGHKSLESRGRAFAQSSAFPFAVLAGCMLCIYAWHAFAGALSTASSLNELIRWGICGSAVCLIWRVSLSSGGARLLRILWHLTGLLLCGSALLAVYGLAELPHAIYRTADAAVSAGGARLGGLLQYPNTFGAVMAAFLLERLFALPAALRARRGPLARALALLPLAPYTAALLLTESRGAWLAAALACAAGLAAQRRDALLLAAAFAAPAAGAALLYRQLAAVQLAPAVLPGLLWLAGLWAGGVLAGLWLCRGFAGGTGAVPRRLWAAAGLWGAAGAAVWAAAGPRLGGGQTLDARRLMYEDARQLVQAAPWLGQGGDTWRLSYRAIQSEPYVGAEVHSGYLDLLLNTGTAGAAAAAMLLAWTVYRIARLEPLRFPAFLVLVLHSAVDFDWRFTLVWLLLACLAGGEGARGEARPLKVPQWVRRFSLLAPGLLLVCWTLLSASLWMGEHAYKQAQKTNNLEERVVLLQSAVSYNPFSPKYAAGLAGCLPVPSAARVLERGLAFSPGHPDLSWALAESYAWSGDTAKAGEGYRVSIERDRYNKDKHARAVYRMSVLSRFYESKARQSEAREAARAALRMVSVYEAISESLSQVGEHGRKVSVQPGRAAAVRNDRGFLLNARTVREGRRLTEWLRESSSKSITES